MAVTMQDILNSKTAINLLYKLYGPKPIQNLPRRDPKKDRNR